MRKKVKKTKVLDIAPKLALNTDIDLTSYNAPI